MTNNEKYKDIKVRTDMFHKFCDLHKRCIY